MRERRHGKNVFPTSHIRGLRESGAARSLSFEMGCALDLRYRRCPPLARRAGYRLKVYYFHDSNIWQQPVGGRKIPPRRGCLDLKNTGVGAYCRVAVLSGRRASPRSYCLAKEHGRCVIGNREGRSGRLPDLVNWRCGVGVDGYW